MIFFGIINIPLFKYFCDLPTFSLVEENINFFYKLYFLGEFDYSFNFYFFSFFFFYIDYFYFFLFYFIYYIYVYFFFMLLSIDYFYFFSDYIEVIFQTSTSNFNFIEFCTLQKLIYVVPSETHLVFFRMYNAVGYGISGISIYILYPTDYLIYFNKVQCFCFEELLIYPYESIDLPVVFYISNGILNYIDFFYSNKLYLSYLFLVR